jgi:hypothetical protein
VTPRSKTPFAIVLPADWQTRLPNNSCPYTSGAILANFRAIVSTRATTRAAPALWRVVFFVCVTCSSFATF